jgi:hypothetical protein
VWRTPVSPIPVIRCDLIEGGTQSYANPRADRHEDWERVEEEYADAQSESCSERDSDTGPHETLAGFLRVRVHVVPSHRRPPSARDGRIVSPLHVDASRVNSLSRVPPL